jgi:SAM-dependent methyltransferase
MNIARMPSEASAPTVPDYLLPSRQAIDQHGPEAFDALLFFDQTAQERRFEVFASTVGLAGRSIADVGCGRADLLAWMRRQGIACADYVGCDAMPEFVSYCQRREAAALKASSARFFLADFVADRTIFERLVDEEKVNTLLFSGSLNTLDEATAKTVLERAWQSLGRQSGGILAFNFLSQIENQPKNAIPTNLDRFGALGLVAWALERTPLVLFCQYYLGGHDATIIMVKP